MPTRQETVDYADVIYRVLREELITLLWKTPSKLVLKDLHDDEKRCSEWATNYGYRTTSYHFYGMFGLTNYVSTGYGITQEHIRTAVGMDLGFEETVLLRRKLLQFPPMQRIGGQVLTTANPPVRPMQERVVKARGT